LDFIPGALPHIVKLRNYNIVWFGKESIAQSGSWRISQTLAGINISPGWWKFNGSIQGYGQ
jgi:hypothetical protein